MTTTNIAIIGAGNAGCAFAAHLKLLGHGTRLYDKFESQLVDVIKADNWIELDGDLDDSLELPTRQRIDYVGTDLPSTVVGAEIVLCTTPAHAHRAVAQSLAKHLQNGQMLVLNPGRTCGALEVSQVLRESGAAEGIVVIEAQTLLYACRKNLNKVHVFGTKDRVACASLNPQGLAQFLGLIQPSLPQFVVAEQGLWETSLDNIGMLFHPTPTLLNLARMESGETFDYYLDGMTPTVAAQVEKIDSERCAVAKALGVQLPTVTQWLEVTYGACGNDLYEAVQNNKAYVGITAPKLSGVEAKQSLRYVAEDVPTGLVPVSDLGRRLGVPTPEIDLVISLASSVYGRDFRSAGRTLDRLGLSNLTAEQLKSLDVASLHAISS